MASPLAILRENIRQRETGDTRFLRNLLYFFELRVPAALTGDGPTTFLFPLVISPESIELDEPFTVEATPTQGGGLYIEENGIVQRKLRIKGHTGWKLRKYQGDDLFSPSEPAIKSFGRTLPPLPKKGFELSGQRHFEYLQDACFRTYADLKADPSTAEETRLIFHNQKDDEHWVVVPEMFRLMRDKSQRFLYQYHIELLVVAPADVRKLEPSEDKSLLDQVRDAARTAKRALDIVSGTINDVTALVGEITQTIRSFQNIFQGITEIADSLSRFVEGTASLISTPLALVNNLKTSIEDSLAAYQDVIETGEQVRQIPDEIVNSLRQAQRALEQLGMHPNAFADSATQTIERIKQRQQTLTSASPRTLQAALQSTPSSFSEYEQRGSALTAGQVIAAQGQITIGQEPQRYTGARVVRLRQGDTLISLAARYLNDARRWQEIAVLNGLRAPFTNAQANVPIVTATDAALPGVGGIGNEILIPTFDRRPNVTPNAPVLGAKSSDSLERQLLGADLLLEPTNLGRPGAPRYDVPIDALRGSKDVRTVAGVSNLKQALVKRMGTERGQNLLFRNVGVDRIIGLNNSLVDQETARFRIAEAITQDPRIGRVRNLRVDYVETTLEIEADLEVRGFQEGVTIRSEF